MTRVPPVSRPACLLCSRFGELVLKQALAFNSQLNPPTGCTEPLVPLPPPPSVVSALAAAAAAARSAASWLMMRSPMPVPTRTAL